MSYPVQRVVTLRPIVAHKPKTCAKYRSRAYPQQLWREKARKNWDWDILCEGRALAGLWKNSQALANTPENITLKKRKQPVRTERHQQSLGDPRVRVWLGIILSSTQNCTPYPTAPSSSPWVSLEGKDPPCQGMRAGALLFCLVNNMKGFYLLSEPLPHLVFPL